jgi:hypothetical protein
MGAQLGGPIKIGYSMLLTGVMGANQEPLRNAAAFSSSKRKRYARETGRVGCCGRPRSCRERRPGRASE